MAIVRGNPKHISIHHSAVNPPAMNMAELKQRAAAHNNFHRANSEAWNNTTPGEYGYKWIRYHYMIAQDGSVLQTQHEKYALYANGDGVGSTSFNITAVNIMVEGNYEIAKPTEAMMLALVKLIREIEARYKINPMVRGHKELSSTGTACPGKNIGTSKSGWLQQVIANVNDKNYPKPEDWRTEAKKLSQPTTYITTVDTSLFEIDTGKRVADFSKGSKIDISYDYKDYLLTAWSYDRKIKNGFRKKDLEIYTKPTLPPVEPEPIEPEVPCKEQEEEIMKLEKKVIELKERIISLEEVEGKWENYLTSLLGQQQKNEEKIKNLREELLKKEGKIAKLKETQGKQLMEYNIREIFDWFVLRFKSVWQKKDGSN